MGGPDNTHRGCGTVLFVVRMQDQQLVKGLDNLFMDLVLPVRTLEHHLMDVLNITKGIISVIQG